VHIKRLNTQLTLHTLYFSCNEHKLVYSLYFITSQEMV